MTTRLLTFFLFLLYLGLTNYTIAIIGTNDIHGSAFPTEMVRSDTGEKYMYGGLPTMGGLINIIKQENQGNVIYLDAGDQFQGGIQSSSLVSSGKIMNDFFNLMEVNGSAIGNHQFDFGPSFLFPFMEGKDSPNLAANLRSEKGQKNFLPKQKSSKMYTFKNGIKLGVIGLSTIQTPTTTGAFNNGKFPQYKFLQYRDIVIQQSKNLRKEGANAVVIVSHVGDRCNGNFQYGIWTKDTPQNECQRGQITELIDSLPENTIDGIVQGHIHEIVHHFRNGIPYMGNINGGYYFNVMYLTFNSKKKLIDAKIQGPIPVCQRIFSIAKTCHFMSDEDLPKAGELRQWRFHNHDVIPDPRVETVFQEEWLPLMQPFLEDLVVNKVFLSIHFDRECELGNLITNSIYANFSFADFVVTNPGGFRTQWLPGMLKEKDFYNMFPFGNILKSFNISGAELKETLNIIQSGSAGFYQFYGIQTTATIQNNQKKFISAKMMDGSEIDEDKYYIGITNDFLLQGGDDFSKVIGKIYTPRNVKDLGEIRESIRQPLKDIEVIEPGTLIDPDHPRIILV